MRLSAADFGINFGDTLGSISNNKIATNNLSGGYGIYVAAAATIFGNDVSANYVGISSDGGDATVYGNTIDGNGTGLQGSGTLGGTSWAAGQPNVVYDNTIGIQSYQYGETTVQFNRVYDNVTGVEATGSGDTIQHDLIYRNTGAGVLIQGGSNVAVTSNTIYTPSGDGVYVNKASNNVSLLNNILWTDSGYDLYVATDSQVGFSSDYNNLFTTNPGDPATTPGTAALVWWQKSFTDLFDWQAESGYNVHSIGYTAPAPHARQPAVRRSGRRRLPIDGRCLHEHRRRRPGQPTGPAARPQRRPHRTGRLWRHAAGGPVLSRVPPHRLSELLHGLGGRRGPRHSLAQLQRQRERQHPALRRDGNHGTGRDCRRARRAGLVWLDPAVGGSITGDPSARYVVRITADSDVAVSTASREPFAAPAASSHYYINGPSTVGDEYATAAGNDRNTGTTPGDPKANLLPLLQSYAIGSGDTVYIDTGTYVEVRNVVLSGNPTIGTGAGAVFTGPDNGQTATLDRGNPNSYSTNIELDDAGSVTLTHLDLVGANLGLWVHDQSIRFTGAYLTLADNAGNGMTVESDSSQSVFSDLTAYGNGGDGIDISTAIASLSNSRAYDNGGDGIDLDNPGPALVQNDVAYGNQTGIYIANSGGGSQAIVGDPNLSSDPSVATNGNLVYDNSLAGINVSRQRPGRRQHRLRADGSGVGIAVSGGVAQQNVVHDNYYGISVSSYGGSGQALDNRVYNNSQAGINVPSGGTIVQGNTVYSNGLGVRLFYYGNDQLSNNLIYANLNQGVLVNDVTSYYGGARSPTTRSISRRAMPSTSRAAPAASR